MITTGNSSDEFPTLNVPLLRKILEHITAHPEDWNQEKWASLRAKASCGTAYCVAGHAAALAGWQPESLSPFTTNANFVRVVEGVEGTEEEFRHVRWIARDELGLTDDEADALFNGNNSLHDLRTLAHVLSDGELELPDDVSKYALRSLTMSGYDVRHQDRALTLQRSLSGKILPA